MRKASFVQPMLLRPRPALPDGSLWLYELKFDGYRAIAFRTGGRVHLRSRNNNDFNAKYPSIAKALAGLPDDTTIDGEIVALDQSGRPAFNALQNSARSKATIVYFVFDVMMLNGRDLVGETLETRRHLLQNEVLPRLNQPIRLSPELQASVADLVESVKAQGLEGLVAKRRDSCYEAGQRSGAWQKMRINQIDDFVIGGYTVGGRTFDALIFGYYDNSRLMYVARTRNGFTPLLREQLLEAFRGLEIEECPFANLPEKHAGRWGQGLTAAKMSDCRWLTPALTARLEFLERTPDGHLRHARFVTLRKPSGE